MSELVDRLRMEARRDPEIQHSGHSILSDAADEIEQLRAEVKHWSEYESETWKAMKASNERMQEALEELDQHASLGSPPWYVVPDHVIEKARAAIASPALVERE